MGICSNGMLPFAAALSCIFTFVMFIVIHLVAIDEFESDGNQTYNLYPFVISSFVNPDNGAPANGTNIISSGCISSALAVTNKKQGTVQWLQVGVPMTGSCFIYNGMRAFLVLSLFFSFVNLVQLVVYCTCGRCGLCGIVACGTYVVSVASQWIALFFFLGTGLGQGHTPQLTALQSDSVGDWSSATPYVTAHNSVLILAISASFASFIFLIGSVVVIRKTRFKCSLRCDHTCCGLCENNDEWDDFCSRLQCCIRSRGNDDDVPNERSYFKVPNGGDRGGGQNGFGPASVNQSRFQSRGPSPAPSDGGYYSRQINGPDPSPSPMRQNGGGSHRSLGPTPPPLSPNRDRNNYSKHQAQQHQQQQQQQQRSYRQHPQGERVPSPFYQQGASVGGRETPRSSNNSPKPHGALLSKEELARLAARNQARIQQQQQAMSSGMEGSTTGGASPTVAYMPHDTNVVHADSHYQASRSRQHSDHAQLHQQQQQQLPQSMLSQPGMMQSPVAAAAMGSPSPSGPMIVTCRVCNINPRDCFIEPCAHFIMCVSCANQLTNCPVCGAYIAQRFRYRVG